MNQQFKIYFASCFLMIFFSLCKEQYIPPTIALNNNFLVVQGFINSGNDSSTITLSRTRNLSDSSFTVIPELFANIFIDGESGSEYSLKEEGNGTYVTGELNLNPSEKYKLRIVTSNNAVYESDFVAVQQTPSIDSVSWQQNNDVNIFLNTHDPSNNTRYYRWEFKETWEYHAFYDSNLGYSNGSIYYKQPADYLTVCYQSDLSDKIILGTSAKLSEDVIELAPITTITNGSDKISARYSILVKQNALTQKAFEYWQLVQKSSQQSGTLFDAQPSQLIGNFHSTTNAAEPVIGYLSISSVQEKRMFIKRSELTNWNVISEESSCEPRGIPTVSDSLYYYLNDGKSLPAYYFGMGGFYVAIAKANCVDCRLKGGTTQKPSYW